MQAGSSGSFFQGGARDTTTAKKPGRKKPTSANNARRNVLDKGNGQDAVRDEVRREINSKIHQMGKSGLNFDSQAAYGMDPKLAGDSEYLVQGRDPLAARSSDRYATTRKIVPERKHWIANRQGYYMTPYGKVAYVHTDGSVAMLRHGSENQCQCGAVHMA
jgi:hypothetical protein